MKRIFTGSSELPQNKLFINRVLLPFKTLIIIVFIGSTFFSCKKEAASSAPFSFKIGNRTYVIDTLKFAKVTATSGGASGTFFQGKSKDGKYTIMFTCNNQQDTVSEGHYIISNLPLSTNDRRRVQDFLITISDSADPNHAWYYKAEANFSIDITELKGNYISGNFSGSITGGEPVGGGFSPSTFLNIRTVEVEGNFGTIFYPL